MIVDGYASMPHYWQHIEPVWEQLQARGVAGVAYVPGTTRPHRRRDRTRPIIVAGFADYLETAPQRVVYVEHGAGQTYTHDDGSPHAANYSGGPGLDRVVLFVAPSETVAQRWRDAYPSTSAVAVGCPFLDRWHSYDRRCDTLATRTPRMPPGRFCVALTFHWECRVMPETRSAWPHYDRALVELRQWADENGVRLIGHGHPRIFGRLARRWRHLGVPHFAGWGDVIDRADVLVADNTSAMFEFASLDRPVVVCNAPWYRRDVEHGGRFWQWADVGVQVDEPNELVDGVVAALVDGPRVRGNRRRVVSEVYAATDGHAAERAADAIVEALT